MDHIEDFKEELRPKTNIFNNTKSEESQKRPSTPEFRRKKTVSFDLEKNTVHELNDDKKERFNPNYIPDMNRNI